MIGRKHLSSSHVQKWDFSLFNQDSFQNIITENEELDDQLSNIKILVVIYNAGQIY